MSVFFDGNCISDCSRCMLKLNREYDDEDKDLSDDNIYFEYDVINKLGINWCAKRYCNFDGCNSDILVDVKNKCRKDGSGEVFTRYNHDLGLIISSNEVESLSNFKTMLKMKYGFIVYNFEDGMYAAEISNIKRNHISAPIGNKIVYYVDFSCWFLISNYEDLMVIGRKSSDYLEYNCLECGLKSFDVFHNKCQIKNLKRRLLASQGD